MKFDIRKPKIARYEVPDGPTAEEIRKKNKEMYQIKTINLFGPFIKLDPNCKILLRCIHCKALPLCEHKISKDSQEEI